MKRTILLSISLLFLVACSSKPDVEGKWKNDKGNLLYIEKNDVAYFAQDGQPQKDKAQYHISKDTVIVKQIIPNVKSAFVEYSFMIEKDQLKLVQIMQSVSGDERRMKGDALAQQMRVQPATLIFKRAGK